MGTEWSKMWAEFWRGVQKSTVKTWTKKDDHPSSAQLEGIEQMKRIHHGKVQANVGRRKGKARR